MTNAIRAALAAMILAWLAAAPAATRAQPAPPARDEESALASAKASMVRVSEIAFYADGPQLVGWGSGFVVAPGYVVTNYHVVEHAAQDQAGVMVTPAASTEGRPVAGRVVQVWEAADLALVRVEGLTAPALVVATGEPDQTKTVRALGYPGATCRMLGCTGRDIVEPAQPNATEGTIAVFEDRAPNGAQLPTIFHTAEVSEGNSGGPLIDRCGRVLGVNTWTAAGEIDMEGRVSMPGGQHVASRASTLVQFLERSGVVFTREAGVCMTAADVAAAEAQRRLDEAERAVRELQQQREAERLAQVAAKAKADADRRAWGLAASIAALAGAGAAALYFIWRRRLTPAAEPQPAAQVEPGAAPPIPVSPSSSPSPVEVAAAGPSPLLVGVGVLGIAGLAGLAALLWAGRSPPAAPAAAETSAPPPGVVRLDCAPDAANSFGPDPVTPVSFIFDSQLQCVNGRTAYSATSAGYERYIVHRDEPSISHNLITRDLKTFTQEEYAVPSEQWQAWTAAMRKPPACATNQGGVSEVERRLGATAGLRGRLPSMPVAKATRRCTWPR